MKTCPDENQLLEWCRGSAADGPTIAAHIEACADCQLLVGVLKTQAGAHSSPDGELPPLGAVLNGRYRLLEPVGAGAMGVVFRAFDAELEREVALKLVKGSADAAARRGGLDEARALARLNHPNVVAVYDAFAHGPWDALAMEFVLGEDLSHWLRTPHPRREREQVLAQAVAGLEAAHLAGVVHRDFKPANVLVGADGRVRVSDFGLSRSHARLGVGPALSTAPAGTPAYMAPELLRGEPSSPASDQYALCLTALETLTGNRVPDTSRRLLPWSRGVHADPARRWGSLTELRQALAARTRRRRLALGAALLVLVGLTALGVATFTPPPPPAACATLAQRADALSAGLVPFEASFAGRLPAPSASRATGLLRDHLVVFHQLLEASCRPEREPTRAQLQTARLACLERTLFNLEATQRTATDGDTRRAWYATAGYGLLQDDPRARCADDRRVRAQALTASPTTDSGLDRDVERLVTALDAGEDVSAALEPLLAQARAAKAAWAEATLLGVRATQRHDVGDLDAARADLEAAVALAEAAGLDLLSFTLSRERLSFARSPEDVQAWLVLARVRAARLGTEALVEGDLLEAAGLGLWNVGELGAAAERFRAAAKTWAALLTAEDFMVGQVEQLEGRALAELGRFDEATALLERAEQRTVAAMGADAPHLLHDWAARARLELLRERPQAARRYLEQARAQAGVADAVPWWWLGSLEGTPPPAPGELDPEAAVDVAVIEGLERLASGARAPAAVPAGEPRSPMHWLAVALAARTSADRATAQHVVDTPASRTGLLARAHALEALGRHADATALVDARLLSPRRPVGP